MRNSVEYTIMSAKADTGIGNNILVQDFRHCVVTVNTASSANGTIKFQGAISETVPDFAAAQSPTNAWDYVEVKDLQDGSAIDGDTGLAPAGTDDNRIFEININGLRWLNARITAIAAGNFTVKVRLFND
jgi:hypothetical protein